MKRLILATLLVGCGAPPAGTLEQPVLVPTDGSGSGGGGIPSIAQKRVTVSGHLYYNDQRSYGRFQIHRQQGGGSGTQYRVHDDVVATGTHSANNLSLIDATVEIYEIDLNYSNANCAAESLVATVTTDSNGYFSWTGDVLDTCALDDVYETSNGGTKGVSIGVKAKLRFCPDSTQRCFSVKYPPEYTSTPAFADHGDLAVVYSLWSGAASNYDPRRVYNDNVVVSLDDWIFATSGGARDHYAQAAMVFSGLSEATRKLHTDLAVPFRGSTFGEMEAIYPMKWPNHGAGHSHEHRSSDFADRICIPAPGTEDSDGWTPGSLDWGRHDTEFHEYGHIVNYRAWEGFGKYVDYGYDGCDKDLDNDGVQEIDCSGEADSAEFEAAAFKEQWANFIKRVVLTDVEPTAVTKDYQGCAFVGAHNATSWDNTDVGATAQCHPDFACTNGDRNPDAVLHTLCDLYDNHADDNASPSFPGADTLGTQMLDGTVTDLFNAWRDSSNSARQQAYQDASASSSNPAVTKGIALCDLMKQRSLRLPDTAGEIVDLLSLNGIECENL